MEAWAAGAVGLSAQGSGSLRLPWLLLPVLGWPAEERRGQRVSASQNWGIWTVQLWCRLLWPRRAPERSCPWVRRFRLGKPGDHSNVISNTQEDCARLRSSERISALRADSLLQPGRKHPPESRAPREGSPLALWPEGCSFALCGVARNMFPMSPTLDPPEAAPSQACGRCVP